MALNPSDCYTITRNLQGGRDLAIKHYGRTPFLVVFSGNSLRIHHKRMSGPILGTAIYDPEGLLRIKLPSLQQDNKARDFHVTRCEGASLTEVKYRFCLPNGLMVAWEQIREANYAIPLRGSNIARPAPGDWKLVAYPDTLEGAEQNVGYEEGLLAVYLRAGTLQRTFSKAQLFFFEELDVDDKMQSLATILGLDKWHPMKVKKFHWGPTALDA